MISSIFARKADIRKGLRIRASAPVRRASLIDLAQPEMRPLIDLRFQPYFMARTSARPAEVPTGSMGRTEELPSMVAPAARADGANPQRTSH